jgi:hypothetical protein
MIMAQSREEWAEDHGYHHWKCRKCGASGWTDTQPDCCCMDEEPRQVTEAEADYEDGYDDVQSLA